MDYCVTSVTWEWDTTSSAVWNATSQVLDTRTCKSDAMTRESDGGPI